MTSPVNPARGVHIDLELSVIANDHGQCRRGGTQREVDDIQGEAHRLGARSAGAYDGEGESACSVGRHGEDAGTRSPDDDGWGEDGAWGSPAESR